jgi:hypothetical protein
MPMKSAYELAMERLEKKAPTKKLTPEQLREIAEIDSVYKAKIAERETYLNSKITEAKSMGDLESAGKFQEELVTTTNSNYFPF